MKPKYICTMGPSIDKDEMLIPLVENGLDTIRFNMSRIDIDLMGILNRIKILNDKHSFSIKTMMDTKGPEMRIKTDTMIAVSKDDLITIGESANFILDFPVSSQLKPDDSYYFSLLKLGDIFYINDGLLLLEVVKIEHNSVLCKALNKGLIKKKRSVYCQPIDNVFSFLSNIDKEHIKIAFQQNLNYLALSFVQNAENIIEVRNIQKLCNNHDTKIIAKIETAEACDNFDEILLQADGIMFARGDLGVQADFTKIPRLQLEFMQKTLKHKKMWIAATGFLKSLKENIIPERSELNDLFYTFLFGTEYIMFSGETAVSNDPMYVLKEANIIFKEAERYKRTLKF